MRKKRKNEIALYTTLPKEVKESIRAVAKVERRSMASLASLILCRWVQAERNSALQDQDA